MNEHEKARMQAAIARGKLVDARNAARLPLTSATAVREGETHDGYAPSRIILQKKAPTRR
jgi:hypothetical protein